MKLRTVIENYLFITRKTQQEFSAELGWNATSLGRFLKGKNLDQAHLAALLIWLLKEEEDDGPDSVPGV